MLMYKVLVFIFFCFLVSYVMSSGYKPAPLDLNHVKLTPNQNQLVEKLAENGHNVWARDRVRQGWTYSIVQVDDVDTDDSVIKDHLGADITVTSLWWQKNSGGEKNAFGCHNWNAKFAHFPYIYYALNILFL